ncbi:MAG: phosphoglucomutase, partial [Methanotrichaceae archaeon]|nr:phosphoglucomutase [Methanotrichaceae archaeon]
LGVVYKRQQKGIRLKEDPANVMIRLKERLSEGKPDTTDGLKITTDGYSILIRPSNTEPLIRLYVETSGKDMKELTERYETIIKEAMKS